MKAILSLLKTLLIVLMFSSISWADIPSEQKSRVLILNSYHPYYSWSDDEMKGILETLKERMPAIEPIIEYLDCKYFPELAHFPRVASLLAYKFKNVKIPVVIAVDNPALDFAIKYRSELFPDAAIVFCGINGYTPELIKGAANITGVAEVLDSRGTVEMMLKLHPAARQIFVIHDYTSTGIATRRETEAQLAPLAGRIKIRYMEHLTTDQMLEEIGRLPEDAMVLALSYSRDREGRVFNHPQIARLLSEKSRVPVYAAHEERLGAGIVGGSMLGGRLHAAEAAKLALKILGGTPAGSIPVIAGISEARPMFDYKQLVRFGISMDSLPAHAIIINQPESFYRQHTLLVWVTSGVMAALLIIIGLLVYVAKIRQQTAESLAEKASELERRVAERTIELKTANEELESFSYSVSHDLRAPLRHIHGFSQILFLDYRDRIDDIGRDYLHRIGKAVGHLNALIDDLLGFSMVGRMDIRPVNANMSRLAESVVSMFRESEPERLVEISIMEGLTAKGDTNLLEIVLQNLIGNAWKYSAKNTSTQDHPASIEFGRTVIEGVDTFYVRDNGVGFDMEYKEKLFKVFERLHGEEFAGTGVGLATVHRIVTRHGGKIWADSEPGKGAVFYFTLNL
ncbi:MAG TPA: ATP-binding protein [Dongiaceae bacterium]|nr:ATP-binding protein [Dongiaceae bacterium]